MSIKKEDAYQHALCMDLQSDRLQYAVVHQDSKKIVYKNDIQIESFERDAIKALMTDEVFGFEYGSYVATAAGKRNTLVPVDIFNYSKAEDIFKLNYPAPFDNLDYNRIPELGMVNIYELPVWIKSLFVIKFPRIKITHPATVLLKGVFDEDAWRQRIHLYIEKDSFYLLITAKNKLEYFNRFDMTNFADLIYHILFVLEQKEISQDKVEASVYGVSGDWEHKTEFQSYFKQIVKIDGDQEKGEHFILAKQLLCV